MRIVEQCRTGCRAPSPLLPLSLSPCLVALLFLFASPAQAATIEFLSGAKVECKVLSKDDKIVTVEAEIGGKTVKKSYPLSTIHVVTINDKRYVINEKTDGSAGISTPKPKPATSKTSAGNSEPDEPAAADGAVRRTRAEVEALIDKLGREPPEWFQATPLNYPKSLDLKWPEKAEGWNNQANVGQFIWDIINPNPGKWREGVKLLHHLLTLEPADLARRVRIMNALATMYHNLHEDWARAAFWWRQSGVDKTDNFPNLKVHLAECYWRLGNKQMAVELLGKLRSYPASAVKLFADLGELPKAIQMADAFAKSPGSGADLAYMYVADGYRQQGKSKEALAFYQKVLDLSAEGNAKGRIEKTQKRAKESFDAVKLMDLANVSRVRDGMYQAQALGYEGDVQVTVTVASGKITTCRVTQHREKQFYSSLTDTPAKIIAKQGVKGVDATSGATITSEAIINATAKALASGAK